MKGQGSQGRPPWRSNEEMNLRLTLCMEPVYKVLGGYISLKILIIFDLLQWKHLEKWIWRNLFTLLLFFNVLIATKIMLIPMQKLISAGHIILIQTDANTALNWSVNGWNSMQKGACTCRQSYLSGRCSCPSWRCSYWSKRCWCCRLLDQVRKFRPQRCPPAEHRKLQCFLYFHQAFCKSEVKR